MTPSRREQQVIDYISRYSAEFGHAPYQWQIAAHLKTDSRGYVCRMLDSLQRKGAIERKYGSPRSITVVSA
jgi:SOS-response transcriptional repressor LexA